MMNYKKLLILTLPLLTVALSAVAETPPVVIGLNNQGVKALNDKDYDTAIAKFEEALAGDPLYSLARDNMGIACNNKGLTLESEPKQAIKWFERALFYSSGNKTTAANLDGIMRRLGLDPASFEDRVKLGDQAFNEKRIYGAVVEYRAALNIKPDADVGARLAAALKEDFSPNTAAVPNSDPQKAAKIKEIEALLDAQKWSEASPLLDAMVKQHPGDAIAWYNLGICRQAAGDFPAALACYGMAKTLRPKDLEIQKAFDGVMGPR
jgi:tetratricopeptide (TPR) repeat protein